LRQLKMGLKLSRLNDRRKIALIELIGAF
jgi:hypothetical protein